MYVNVDKHATKFEAKLLDTFRNRRGEIQLPVGLSGQLTPLLKSGRSVPVLRAFLFLLQPC